VEAGSIKKIGAYTEVMKYLTVQVEAGFKKNSLCE